MRTEERCCFTVADLLIITTLKMIKDFTFFLFSCGYCVCIGINITLKNATKTLTVLNFDPR